jgi:predicted dehydrogenase
LPVYNSAVTLHRYSIASASVDIPMPSHSRNPETSVTRRQFASVVTAVGAAAVSAPARATTRPQPSDRITIGIVGLGSRGFNLLDDFLGQPKCQIVALCDFDEFHHRDQPWGKGKTFGRKPAEEHVKKTYGSDSPLQVYADYRELIARKEIDAVVVATPDHWHALCTFEALQAGKDVYCEKPITHLFAEGQTIVAEVARQKAVFQTGSQQRSDPLFQKLVEIVHNGLIGDVQTVEVGLPPGYAKPMGSTEVVEPRAGLNYEFWCGPSTKLPLMQARHHRWWRGHTAFGGGVLMDWIGHHNDIAHWAIGVHRSGPVKVEAVDWVFPDTNVYNTPEQYTIRCEYAGGITSTISSRNPEGLKIIGSKGWVFARRGKIEASDKRWLASDFVPGPIRIQSSSSHAANFLENIDTRGECIAPAEIAHRAITPGHLGYVSAALGKPLSWDPITETIVGDDAADRLLKTVEYRAPWQPLTVIESA